MKKNVVGLLFLLLWGVSCNDAYKESGFDELEEKGIPPGEAYTAQGKYNLNVVYYVPADMDSMEMWHKRLSGITLHIQEFYRQGLKRYNYEKKFGLCVNDVNPDYIKIAYIKGSKNYKDSKFESITGDVMNYYKEHATEQASNHFLVYMPQNGTASYFESGYRSSASAGSIPDYGFAIAGCDMIDFNIKHFTSKKARERYLNKLGYVMHELGHAFYLPHVKETASDVFYSVMGMDGGAYGGGHNSYAKEPDMLELTWADAMFLSRIQVFNQEHDYGKEEPDVTIEDLDVYYRNDSVCVDGSFRSSSEIVGMVMYSDPWRTQNKSTLLLDEEYERDPNTKTDDDALSVCTEQFAREGDLYKFTCKYSWKDIYAMHYAPVGYMTKGKAALRFRFVASDGLTCPFPGVSWKGGEHFRWEFDVTRIVVDRFYVYIPEIPVRE